MQINEDAVGERLFDGFITCTSFNKYFTTIETKNSPFAFCNILRCPAITLIFLTCPETYSETKGFKYEIRK